MIIQNNETADEVYNRTKEPIREQYVKREGEDEKDIEDHALDNSSYDKQRYRDPVNYDPSDYVNRSDDYKPQSKTDEIKASFEEVKDGIRQQFSVIREKFIKPNSELEGDKSSKNDNISKKDEDVTNTIKDHVDRLKETIKDTVQSNIGAKTDVKAENKDRANKSDKLSQKDPKTNVIDAYRQSMVNEEGDSLLNKDSKEGQINNIEDKVKDVDAHQHTQKTKGFKNTGDKQHNRANIDQTGNNNTNPQFARNDEDKNQNNRIPTKKDNLDKSRRSTKDSGSSGYEGKSKKKTTPKKDNE